MKALIVVDVQNDFCEGGSLAVAGGHAVAAGISRLLAQRDADYSVVVATRDWHHGHDDNGGHFATTAPPDFRVTWPRHCVQDESGSDYAPQLVLPARTVHVRKGRGVPAYSGFEGAADDGRPLADVLREAGVTEVDVAGIATDFCVRATAADALAAGFTVTVLTDLVAAVDPVRGGPAALAALGAAGATLDKG